MSLRSENVNIFSFFGGVAALYNPIMPQSSGVYIPNLPKDAPVTRALCFAILFSRWLGFQQVAISVLKSCNKSDRLAEILKESKI
jgi:hypothetical protein